MKCPYCRNSDSRVRESRLGDKKGNTTRRVRECLECSELYTTYEIVTQLKTSTYSDMFDSLGKVEKNLDEMLEKIDEISKFSKEFKENFYNIIKVKK